MAHKADIQVAEAASTDGTVSTAVSPGTTSSPLTRKNSQAGTRSRASTLELTRGAVHARVLQVAVPDHFRRAVRLERALMGFGTFWQGSISGGLGIDKQAQAIYDLSEKVENIDDFLSHDWANKGWMKYITLISVYNFKAAFGWSVLAAFLVSVMEGGILSSGRPLALQTQVSIGSQVHRVFVGIAALIVPPFVFAGVLFFGQHLPRLSRCSSAPVMTFVDKMCIHQTDVELKSQAILCLAGFLKCSNRMVVLWSPRYLTRLWCVYEVAAWTYLGKDFGSSVVFAPTTLYAGAFWSMVGTYVYFDVFLVAIGNLVLWVYIGAALAVVLLVCAVPMRLLRRTVFDLGQMQHQFESFRIQSAECFCCKVGHRDPETDEVIPCDRALVCNTLSSWFKKDKVHSEAQEEVEEEDSVEEGEYYLDRFNTFVHEHAGPALCDSILFASNRYWLALRVSTPTIWWMFSRWLVLLQINGVDSFRYIVETVVLAFVVYPCVWFATVRFATFSNWLGGEKALAGGVRDTALTLMAVLSTVVLAAVLWGPLLLTRSMQSGVPQAIAYSMVTVISAANFVLPWRPHKML